MLKKLAQLAVVAAALASASTASHAFIKVVMFDTVDIGNPAAWKVCDTSAVVSATNCGTGFSVITSENVNWASVTGGAIGGFDVTGVLSNANVPGTSTLAFTQSSNIAIERTGVGAGTLYVEVTGLGFTQPLGPAVYFDASASLVGTIFNPATDAMSTRAYFDPTGGGGFPPPLLTCSMVAAASNNCNAGFAVVANPGPTFSLTTIQEWSLGATGRNLQGTSRARITVPEPASLALVGLGLLGAGVVARRRKSA